MAEEMKNPEFNRGQGTPEQAGIFPNPEVKKTAEDGQGQQRSAESIKAEQVPTPEQASADSVKVIDQVSEKPSEERSKSILNGILRGQSFDALTITEDNAADIMDQVEKI